MCISVFTSFPLVILGTLGRLFLYGISLHLHPHVVCRSSHPQIRRPMKIGILRETKTPPDKRVPLTPAQCAEVKRRWPDVELVVQPSPIRKITDDQYTAAGLVLQEDLSDCDVLMGVKEVKMDTLIPSKTYLFFSHTYKLQPYNAKLLRTLLDNKIRLVDYEVLRKPNHGPRIIGFGRYAGVVGCYNGFRTFGIKHGLYDLKAAHACEDRKEMEAELANVKLPDSAKFVLTGRGRVGGGAREIMELMPFIQEVSPSDFLSGAHSGPVFTHLNTPDTYARKSDGGYDRSEFYSDPSEYETAFLPYAHAADMYVACHYWKEGSPFIFTREDMKDPRWKISVVADVSCDIDGPVACTLRPSTIADPMYGYHIHDEKDVSDLQAPGTIAVMAVDNLPCELPKDASEDFGNEMLQEVLPHLLGGDTEHVIWNGTETTLEGTLTPHFAYLEEYAANS